ncbi:MAG: Alkaline phosphatase, partial [uncultured Rubrobacteraceae bacterium]
EADVYGFRGYGHGGGSLCGHRARGDPHRYRWYRRARRHQPDRGDLGPGRRRPALRRGRWGHPQGRGGWRRTPRRSRQGSAVRRRGRGQPDRPGGRHLRGPLRRRGRERHRPVQGRPRRQRHRGVRIRDQRHRLRRQGRRRLRGLREGEGLV